MTKLIVQELMNEIKIEAKKDGISTIWFKFAEKSGLGWRFLPNKEKQWKKLEFIAKKFSKRYPLLTTGQIVDELCELVNK